MQAWRQRLEGYVYKPRNDKDGQQARYRTDLLSGRQSNHYLDFGLPASTTVRQQISVV